LEDVQNVEGWEFFGSPLLDKVSFAKHVPRNNM